MVVFTPRKSGAYVILMHAKEVHQILSVCCFLPHKPGCDKFFTLSMYTVPRIFPTLSCRTPSLYACSLIVPQTTCRSNIFSLQKQLPLRFTTVPVRYKMTDTNQGGDSSKKTYHKKATGNALTTVKNHSKEDDLKLYGSAFW
jgi:hypothetical protein